MFVRKVIQERQVVFSFGNSFVSFLIRSESVELDREVLSHQMIVLEYYHNVHLKL